MVWVVTIHVNDCATGSALSSAAIYDGFNYFYTDSYGEFIAVVDDYYVSYVLQISHVSYVSRSFTISSNQHGTTQTTCLNPAPAPPPGGGGTGSGGCFIVTAASGSAQSQEVARLRGLRDRVSAVSSLSGKLIDAIYEEYAEFSPAIADRLRESNLAKQGALMLAVRPLVAWYTLAGALALDAGDGELIESATEEVRDACPRYLGPGSVAAVLDAIRRGGDLPVGVPETLVQMMPHLRKAAGTRFASWAILEPLWRVWNTTASRLNPVSEVAAWMASAPLEAVPEPDSRQLIDELEALARLFAFQPEAGQQLGVRLMRAWPTVQSQVLRSGLVSLREVREPSQ